MTTQIFNNQILEIETRIQRASQFPNIDTTPWTQQLAIIKSSFETNYFTLEDLALDIANAALDELRQSMTFVYKKLSITNVCIQLSQQMQDAIKKFPRLIKKILPLQEELSELLEDFQNISSDEGLQTRWQEIDEIDITFQKHAALKEIKNEYNNTQAAIQRCAKGGFSFIQESSYAADCYSASYERILSITSPKSPTGMDPKAQIYIATSGTQNALARAKTDIYIKYGMRCIENKIKFYLLKRFHELGGRDDSASFQTEINRIKNEAKEQLIWGENGKPTSSYPNLPAGIAPPPAIAPPLLPLETIDQITEKFITQAHTLILGIK